METKFKRLMGMVGKKNFSFFYELRDAQATIVLRKTGLTLAAWRCTFQNIFKLISSDEMVYFGQAKQHYS